MAYLQLPQVEDFPLIYNHLISGAMLGLFIRLIIDPNYFYNVINSTSEDTFELLVIKQLIWWSLYLESTPSVWEMWLSKCNFWHRYTGKTTKEGALIHHEIRDGFMIFVQHFTSAATIIYGYNINNVAFIKFGATAEIAFEINDTITIITNSSRNKNKPFLIKTILLLHHSLGLISLPIFIYFSDFDNIQVQLISLMTSGAVLCLTLPVQYIPNIKTKSGAITSFIIHAAHLLEFAYLRWYIGFGNNEYRDLVNNIDNNSIAFYPFVFGIICIILFNTIVSVIFVERCGRSMINYLNIRE